MFECVTFCVSSFINKVLRIFLFLLLSICHIFLCRSHIQKSSKDPIPEEEFDFQGIEDEDEQGTDGERNDSSAGDKAERGKRE